MSIEDPFEHLEDLENPSTKSFIDEMNRELEELGREKQRVLS